MWRSSLKGATRRRPTQRDGMNRPGVRDRTRSDPCSHHLSMEVSRTSYFVWRLCQSESTRCESWRRICNASVPGTEERQHPPAITNPITTGLVVCCKQCWIDRYLSMLRRNILWRRGVPVPVDYRGAASRWPSQRVVKSIQVARLTSDASRGAENARRVSSIRQGSS